MRAGHRFGFVAVAVALTCSACTGPAPEPAPTEDVTQEKHAVEQYRDALLESTDGSALRPVVAYLYDTADGLETITGEDVPPICLQTEQDDWNHLAITRASKVTVDDGSLAVTGMIEVGGGGSVGRQIVLVPDVGVRVALQPSDVCDEAIAAQ